MYTYMHAHVNMWYVIGTRTQIDVAPIGGAHVLNPEAPEALNG